MRNAASTMSTDQVTRSERVGFWADWLDRLFHGLASDVYGDADFDGRVSTVHAGDVVLTRLEANRHRVMRSASQVRSSEVGYLKIVAPFTGCAGVEQQGREAWVTPDQWSIFAYPAGAPMVKGNAPAKRIQFFFGAHEHTEGQLNENGIKLLDATIDWALQ